MQFGDQCFTALTCLCRVRQQQLVRLLSQLGDVALGQQRSTAAVRASGGVQTHSLLLEVQRINSTALSATFNESSSDLLNSLFVLFYKI